MVKIPGVIKTTAGAAIASAATVNLANATGNSLHITGSTGPITSFGTVAASVIFTLIFDSTPTITHHATSLILPGAANITAAAGDVMVLRSEGSGNWTCISYTKASGLAVYVTPSPAYWEDSSFTAGEDISAGKVVFIEPPVAVADSTTASLLGDVSANTRVSTPVFGSGSSSSTMSLLVSKVLAPSATLSFRVETDNAGSPSGTLVHANASGTLAAASITGGTTVTDISSIGSTGFGSTTTAYGYTIYSKNTQILTTVTKSTGTGATRCQILSSTGTVLATATFSGNNATFAYPLTAATTYKVVVDNSGASYSIEGSNPGTWPQNKTNINYTANSDGLTTIAYCIASITTDNGVPTAATLTCAGSFSYTGKGHLVLFAGTYGSETINSTNYFRVWGGVNHTTARPAKTWNGSVWSSALATTFIYTSSTLFLTSLLSLADNDYTYKRGIYGIAATGVSAGSALRTTIGGVNLNQTGLTVGASYNLSSTPGDLTTSAGTVIGYALTATQLLLAGGTKYAVGSTTYAVSTANGTQTIPHGLGRMPKIVVIKGLLASTDYGQLYAYAQYDGITQVSESHRKNGNPGYVFQANFRLGNELSDIYTEGTVTFDATNIYIAWVKSGSPTVGTATMNWRAEG